MKQKEYYSIGEASQICGISKKALRFYDKINVISPDKICENNYRYYSKNSLLAIPVVKYYKQMGFTLEEMKSFVEGSTYKVLERTFREKISEIKEEEKEIYTKYISVNDWYELILEADAVIDNNVNHVSVKFVDFDNYVVLDCDFTGDNKEAIINIDFTNYIEKIENKITGPVIINFSSFKDRSVGNVQKIKIMQKPILPCKEGETVNFGGKAMLSCYHIGSINTINDTYKKIVAWAEENGYKCGESSYERYVTDYWTTKNEEKFVTEILIDIIK